MLRSIIRRPVPDEVWESVRAEFALPTLEQVRRRLAELMEDPAPVMRELVRVLIRTAPPHRGVSVPARDGTEDPAQLLHRLDGRPSALLGGARPVDSLPQLPQLHRALEGFAPQPPGDGKFRKADQQNDRRPARYRVIGTGAGLQRRPGKSDVYQYAQGLRELSQPGD